MLVVLLIKTYYFERTNWGEKRRSEIRPSMIRRFHAQSPLPEIFSCKKRVKPQTCGAKTGNTSENGQQICVHTISLLRTSGDMIIYLSIHRHQLRYLRFSSTQSSSSACSSYPQSKAEFSALWVSRGERGEVSKYIRGSSKEIPPTPLSP